ncbi:unnamed protein product, partial [Ectocarpus fasciculatus]
ASDPVADVGFRVQHAPAANVDNAAADDQPSMPERKNVPSPALKVFEAARMAFRATRRGATAVSQDEDHRVGQWGEIQGDQKQKVEERRREGEKEELPKQAEVQEDDRREDD